MKNARTELVDVRDRIDELADKMARVPFNADILAARFIEQPFPHGWLAENVVVHDGQMIRPLRRVLEGDAHALVGGVFGQRLPEFQQAR